MTRHFKHLTKEEIRTVYLGYISETPKQHIARQINKDNATVHYHINKFKSMTDDEIAVLVRPQCAGGHTSFKCLVCGRAHDNIKTEEFQLIKRQHARITELETRLSKYEPPSSDTTSRNPVTTVYL